jgi:glycosyltransferase involved in cell wall biosynthesis
VSPAELPFSVIVPVHDEAARLPLTLPCLLDGLPPGTELIFACNGCSDGSESIISDLAGARARILSLPTANKALAIRAAEECTRLLPRFYVDADVKIAGGDLTRIAALLSEGRYDLVSPRIELELDGASAAARAMHELWLASPHARRAAFRTVLGVSAAARARWGTFPDVMADDTFIVCQVPPERRAVADEVAVKLRPPLNLRAYIGVQERVALGHRQLRALGYSIPHSEGQYGSLLRAALDPRKLPAVILYVIAGLAGRARARMRSSSGRNWYRDESSRSA